MPRQRFGEYLIQQKILSKEAVSAILDEQRIVQDPFGQLAVRRGYIGRGGSGPSSVRLSSVFPCSTRKP
jgi:hypothetical protein